MNMHWIDWGIMGALAGTICVVAFGTRKYTQSVADFLSANRCAGKYLLGVADGIAGLGAVTVVAQFEMHYKAGFTGAWWNSMLLPAGLIIAMSGWVQYRFRETRAMTMAQFFEIRYSRRFRIFSGLLAFVSGTVNFAIFPAVGGRFFQHYCGLPVVEVSLLGTEIDLVYAGIMGFLLSISVAFTFMGGQIAVMVTDFIQGTFCNIMFAILAAYLLWKFDWSVITEALAKAPENASLIHPMKTSETDNFNASYFMIQTFGTFFTFMAWQGNQGYYSSARSPHEAKMGRVVGQIRPLIQNLLMVLLPICAFTALHHALYADAATATNAVLDTVDSDQLRSQLTVTVALANILPVGLLGGFAAVMFAAFVSTHDTYLHAWGSIFVQDVLLPVRNTALGTNRPLAPKTHLWVLRISIACVAVFIFLFSLLFKQKQDIYMYFALTGNIFLGWAGAAICGGLYWKHGTTLGVWAAAVVGMVLAVLGWYMTYFWDNSQALMEAYASGLWAWGIGCWPKLGGSECPINAQTLWLCIMLGSAVVYAVVSRLSIALGKESSFNLDRMLHRGQYARAEDGETVALPPRGLAVFKMGKEFSLGDKFLFLGTYTYSLALFVVFLVGTVYAFYFDTSVGAWATFWQIYCYALLALTVILAVWLAVGGTRDLRALYALLRTVKRDARDDGTVVGNRNLDELEEEEMPGAS